MGATPRDRRAGIDAAASPLWPVVLVLAEIAERLERQPGAEGGDRPAATAAGTRPGDRGAR